MPSRLLLRYHYFNVPAPTDPQDAANPLNMIKSLATADDYVALKIDIDNTDVEMQFVRQLLGDPVAAALVDELFFEHHVNFLPMMKNWKNPHEVMTLKDSYDIFVKLRNMGIRAHGWV